jgi:photosystem II stability/assembly factor-like uncharacterized protein
MNRRSPPSSVCWSLVALLLSGCATVPRGGAWHGVATPGNASLRGIAVVDRDTVWVSGSGGAVWRTTDGGASWRDVAPPGSATSDFRDVEVLPDGTALVMTAGTPGRVHRSTDGGATWTLVLEDVRPDTFFDAMAFGYDQGVLVGDPIDGRFCVWTTRDGGATWAARGPDAPAASAREAAFAASGTCVAWTLRPDGESRAVAWLATGGGEHARVHELGQIAATASVVPLRSGAPSCGAFGLAVAPHIDPMVRFDYAVAVGGDYERPLERDGTAAWTDDGGRTWHAADAGGFRSAAVWLDEDRVLAVGSHGTSLSRDGGRTWTVLGTEGFHCVARGADGGVWAAGAGGRVARWRDD